MLASENQCLKELTKAGLNDAISGPAAPHHNIVTEVLEKPLMTTSGSSPVPKSVAPNPTRWIGIARFYFVHQACDRRPL